MKDYYHILEIHPEASPEVMQKAYRTLVQQVHPDRFHTRDKSRMNAKMRELNEAYETLGNETSRRRYDESYRRAIANGALDPAMGPSRGDKLRNLVFWALGTYWILQLLLRPLLPSPLLRLLLLAAVVFFMLKHFRPPAQA